MTMLTRLPLLLLALAMPGGFVVLVAAYVWKKLQLPLPQSGAYLTDDSGQPIIKWDEYMWHHHPVRYLITVRLPRALKFWWWKRVQDPAYRWKSKYWRKDHLMDLRGSDYEYGYLSPAEKMLYASFQTFMEWLATDGAWVLETVEDPEPDAPDVFRAQSETAKNARILYFWWAGLRKYGIDQIKKIQDPRESEEAMERQVQIDQHMLGLLFSVRSVMLIDGGFPHEQTTLLRELPEGTGDLR